VKKAVWNARHQVGLHVIVLAMLIGLHQAAPLVTREIVQVVHLDRMVGKGSLIHFPVGPPMQSLMVVLLTEDGEVATATLGEGSLRGIIAWMYLDRMIEKGGLEGGLIRFPFPVDPPMLGLVVTTLLTRDAAVEVANLRDRNPM